MAKKIIYSEADLLRTFKLNRVVLEQTPEMARWLNVQQPTLDIYEQHTFDRVLPLAIKEIDNWNEEALKMNFISQILPIGHLLPNGRYSTFYEKIISGEIDGVLLSVKTDFMVATGVLDSPEKPYFHFQEYKPSKRPTGDSMAQLLEAMLIAQSKNNNQKPIYGVEIVGAVWNFVTLKERSYCISPRFISTDREDLLRIIAILRHFKHILETELLDPE